LTAALLDWASAPDGQELRERMTVALDLMSQPAGTAPENR
jgi:hypothetical protein